MISTHILDISRGIPASGIQVYLEKKQAENWISQKSGRTNSDGRFVFDCEVVAGIYQIIFEIEHYFKKGSFFMNTPVVFKIEEIDRKYHVPLLLSPFGYSTYRGS